MKHIVWLVTAAAVLLAGCSQSPSAADIESMVEYGYRVATAAAATATAEARPTTPSATADTSVPTSTRELFSTLRPTVSPTRTRTVDLDIVALGGRCVDQITNESYIFLKDATQSLWGRFSPTIMGIVLQTQGGYDLILEYYYVGDDWLFINELVFNVDGEVIRMRTPSLDTEVLEGAMILESDTISITTSNYDSFSRVISGANVKLRYSGADGLFDTTPDENEIATLRYADLVYAGLRDGSILTTDFEEVCPG